VLFNSFDFAVFLVVVLLAYWRLPEERRWPLLLVASYYFYMCWRPEYAVLILFSTAVDYLAGLRMAATPRAGRKRLWLVLSLTCNLGLLFVFKYLDFLLRSIGFAAAAAGQEIEVPRVDLLLPVGISFYTFQSLSYTIDVYRGLKEPERHFGVFATYVAFFPQLVAGPIERSTRLMPQLRARHQLDYDRFRLGFYLIVWGLFKKVAIADLVAPVVDTVYANPAGFPGHILALATLLFSVQIYCDFSGYSDIAIGVAALFGYDLMTNFRQPYLATSLSDFWRRWHISLSTWFRDYVYLPLGGSRVGRGRYYGNILVVFVVSGLWHGAAWTFVVWGAIHGVVLILESAWRGNRRPEQAAVGWRVWVQRLLVFGVVFLGWVFFRAQSLPDALYVVTHLFDWSGFALHQLWGLGLPRFEMALAGLMIAILAAVDYVLAVRPPRALRLWESRWTRWACASACVWGVVFFGVFEGVEFIYFQF
jgi:alginate O-acetyltransferase complex protein AlgI